MALEGSLENLYDALKELADTIKSLEKRTRVLEDKRIEAEGKMANLLSETKLQLERVASDAESEKRTRKETTSLLTDKLDIITTSINGKMDKITTEIAGKVEDVKKAQDKINLKIAYWSGALAMLYIIGQIVHKFWK